jgi:hypothetical protein
MSKRTLESFFGPAVKKAKPASKVSADTIQKTNIDEQRSLSQSSHSTYPWPISQLPFSVSDILSRPDYEPPSQAKVMDDQTDLDIIYFHPLFARDHANDLFQFLRKELFFYRVEYKIKRGTMETLIKTPRYTTVFGLDETSRFDDEGKIIDAKTQELVPPSAYKTCNPRPLPECLETLRKVTIKPLSKIVY